MRIMSNKSAERIFVAGHRGMVGSALVRALRARGDCQLILRSRDELDLTDAIQVDAFFAENDIDTVYLAAARVGGIHANNSYPAEFIRTNLQIETNVIHHAWRYQVKRLLFLGSSCIYPRNAPQPMREEYLLSGALEPSNEPYAVAKIAGIKLCESYNRQYGTDFRSIMPTNLYGPGDNYHAQDSHVLPALMRRFHDAHQSHQQEVQVWGSGEALREFLYVDDMAHACLWLMDQPREVLDQLTSPQCSHINAGSGEEIRIASLAIQVAEVMGYEGHIVFDRSKPDGTPRKLLDSTRLRSLGWEPVIDLREGLQRTAEDFLTAHAAHPMMHVFSDARDGRRTRDIPRLRL